MNQKPRSFQEFDGGADPCNYFRDAVLIAVYYLGEANNGQGLPFGLSYYKSLSSSG